MSASPIQTIQILGGHGKKNQPDTTTEICFRMGDIISIVGPTGSGKTTLIDDIALFANNSTPSQRCILINGQTIPEDDFADPSKNPVAFITQHTNFLSDLPVQEFLTIHAQIRQGNNSYPLVTETIAMANQLTGEPLDPQSSMTELSGGQTRALLIADAVIIGNSPIILLDEIENAGIHRTKALTLLKQYQKIFIFVTHDPHIALISDYRLVMDQGAIQKVIQPGPEEAVIAEEIRCLDEKLSVIREAIRKGAPLV